MLTELLVAIATGVICGLIIWWPEAYKSMRLKEENERLNEQLRKLTDRDERGRFKGGK